MATPRRPSSPAATYGNRQGLYSRSTSNNSVRPRIYHHASNSSVSSREGAGPGDFSQTDNALSDEEPEFDFDAAQTELRQTSSSSSLTGTTATAPLSMRRTFSNTTTPNATIRAARTELPRAGSPFPTWVPNGADSTPPEAVPALPPSARATPAIDNAAAAASTPESLLAYVLSLRKRPGPGGSSSQGLARTQSETTAFMKRQDSHARNMSTGSANSMDDELDRHRVDLSRSASGNAVAVAMGRKASREPTGLETVDLSHKRAAEIPLSVINALQGHIERLALGYNHLSGLPLEFSQLGNSLRYLNVRVNYLTIFPAVLCEMPSLEILDISRNKIRKLPTNCGTLRNLKVFSISKNRIKRLPAYFAQMSSLRVLKLDHNPLEYPPRDIVSFPGQGSPTLGQGEPETNKNKADEAETMQKWLTNLQSWMADHIAERKPPPRPLAIEPEQISEDDRPHVTRPLNTSRRGAPPLASPVLPSPPISADTPKATRTRAPPMSSSPSSISATASTTSRSTTSPTTSLSYLEPEPPTSGKSTSHARNASTSVAAPAALRRPNLQSKKSLPDLRQSHAQILDDRMGAREAEPETPKLLLNSAALRRPRADSIQSPATNAFPLPSPRPMLNGGGYFEPRRTQTDQGGVSLSPKAQRFAELDRPRRTTEADVQAAARSPRAVTPMGQSPAAEERPVGVDRNSGAYFRRLSMLPPSSISKSVPLTLLHFVDAIRGILFALSQLHSALKQFVVFATPDRLPPALARMMANADGTLGRLINALDRFDSSTRRSTPSNGVLREVFDACRENVAIFGKLVAVLALQLKVLVSTADVRYTRTLLLMLYGSMAEVANAWKTITPLASELGGLLKTDPAQPSAVMLQPPTPSPKQEDTKPLPNVGGARPPASLPAAPLVNGAAARARAASSTARRHAGSFSVEDVRVGAALPQHSPTSSLSFGAIVPNPPPSSTLPPVSQPMRPRPGAPKLSMTLGGPHPPASTLSLSSPASTMPAYRDIFEHLNDLPPTPIGSLPPGVHDAGPPSAYPLPPSGLSASTSALPTPLSNGPTMAKRPSPPPPAALLQTAVTQANEGGVVDDFLDMVDTTTNVAFSVCALLVERPPSASRRAVELVELCEVGKEAAKRLKADLSRLPGAGASPGNASTAEDQAAKWRIAARAMTAVDAKRLWEDSNAFAKAVIQIATLARAVHQEQPFADPAREGISQLAKATNTLLSIAAVAVAPPKGR